MEAGPHRMSGNHLWEENVPMAMWPQACVLRASKDYRNGAVLSKRKPEGTWQGHSADHGFGPGGQSEGQKEKKKKRKKKVGRWGEQKLPDPMWPSRLGSWFEWQPLLTLGGGRPSWKWTWQPCPPARVLERWARVAAICTSVPAQPPWRISFEHYIQPQKYF